MCILCSATACWFAADEISASIANFLQINAEYVYMLVTVCVLLSILEQSDTRPNDSLTYIIDPVLIRCYCVYWVRCAGPRFIESMSWNGQPSERCS